MQSSLGLMASPDLMASLGLLLSLGLMLLSGLVVSWQRQGQHETPRQAPKTPVIGEVGRAGLDR